MNSTFDAARAVIETSSLTSNPDLSQNVAPQTLIELLEISIRKTPNSLAITDGTNSLTYAELGKKITELASELNTAGIGGAKLHPEQKENDKVVIRVSSGTCDLYVAILATLKAGAAYVPVDVDDPQERAELIMQQAEASAVITDHGLEVFKNHPQPQGTPAAGQGTPLSTPYNPEPQDDAWVIFTSGSTGVPKGVAVSHANAAAFVLAEQKLFCQDHPLGPGDRVLAGLSVGFDASCEEMWLAWGNGACLVAAPRDLVRTGVDLGPWLIAQQITVVSTVPTLAGMWESSHLVNVRLIIFGGEACPPDLVNRLDRAGVELWNTYGPTEATVVSTAARMFAGRPVSIGLPLQGWDVAVVDDQENVLPFGQEGQLVIGGVGLGRYLDPTLDEAKYAPLPALGWQRAYRSGDLVRMEADGIYFVGRNDDQVKIGGRRIELGEIDATLLAAPGVQAGACAVKSSLTGNKLLVGYVVAGPGFDQAQVLRFLRGELPAALVPRLAVVDQIPTKNSGKVDRGALPWPLPTGVENTSSAIGNAKGKRNQERNEELTQWVSQAWTDTLGVPPESLSSDFFAEGGSSLSAAQLISQLRPRFPAITVRDLYGAPSVAKLVELLASFKNSTSTAEKQAGDKRAKETVIPPLGAGFKFGQLSFLGLTTLVTASRWVTWAALASWVWASIGGPDWLIKINPVLLALGVFFLVFPIGKMLLAAGGARVLTAGVKPGRYRRGASEHFRLWAATNWTESIKPLTLSGVAFTSWYARWLGAKIGANVELHTSPPVTGLLTIGQGAAVENETEFIDYWVCGDQVMVGRIDLGAQVTVGARSIILGGANVGSGTDIAPGSAIWGKVKGDQYWGGSPAVRLRRKAKHPWPELEPKKHKRWALFYPLSTFMVSILTVGVVVIGLLPALHAVSDAPDAGAALGEFILWAPLSALLVLAIYLLFLVFSIRMLALGLKTGFVPVRSLSGWCAWLSHRLMDQARERIFPLYSSIITATWLRILGAKVGSNVEISTIVGVPAMIRINEGAFVADDTMVAPYELGGGWLRLEQAKIGKRGFLGNSGIAGPGRTVPKNGLVAVLSATPTKAKSGTTWIGSPPEKLPRMKNNLEDETTTYAPDPGLKTKRSFIEFLRLLPWLISQSFALTAVGFAVSVLSHNVALAIALTGLVLAGLATTAGVLSVLAKWGIVGKFKVGEHPLWSTPVWLGELADTFTEVLAAPWLLNHTLGTPVLNVWLRGMGAKIGRNVWCETYWLPEPDLIEIGEGSSVGRGCVLQTHLFHDRIMALDTVKLAPKTTMGPHGVILPEAELGLAAVVGPASLVMRGEKVPIGSYWRGNPIVAWDVRLEK